MNDETNESLSIYTLEELVNEVKLRSDSGIFCAIPFSQRSDETVDINYWWGNMHTARGLAVHMSEHLERTRKMMQEQGGQDL